MIVRKISKEELVQLRRNARLEKKKEEERALNTTLRDVIEILHADLAAFGANLSQSGSRHESETEGSLVPELPSDEAVGPYEDKEELELLVFARHVGTPVVAYQGQRNKRSEERMRHSAKIRGWRLHYYRLIDGYIAIEVEIRMESDTRFLKTLGIKTV
jgi:hypothetical protein